MKGATSRRVEVVGFYTKRGQKRVVVTVRERGALGHTTVTLTSKDIGRLMTELAQMRRAA